MGPVMDQLQFKNLQLSTGTVLDSAVTLLHFLCHCSFYGDVKISLSKASTSAISPTLNKEEKSACFVVKVQKLRRLKTEFLNI